jgi:hypothetical protein
MIIMNSYITHIIIIILLLYIIYSLNSRESLCVEKPYGIVTDVPASTYIDANMALVHSTSLGQAPLGDPHYWLPNKSPITQGQYGLYQEHTLPLSETQPFDRSTLNKAAMTLPVYTQHPLPPQCSPLN